MAPDELSDTDWQVREVFAYFGRTYYLAEVLHRGLCNLYVVTQLPETGPVTRYRVEEHMAAAFKMTLGQVWNSVAFRFPPDGQRRVECAVERRNFLAHHFWFERIHLMSSADGRAQMMAELEQDASLFEQADSVVEALDPDQWKRFGLDETYLEAAMAEIAQGMRPTPLHSQRRLRKTETIVSAYEAGCVFLETEDGTIWQLCDQGLGWCEHSKADPTWPRSSRLAPYLPAILNPRPPNHGAWNYELSLAQGALLIVRPGPDSKKYRWSIRGPVGKSGTGDAG
jgi:hypothetical protein